MNALQRSPNNRYRALNHRHALTGFRREDLPESKYGQLQRYSSVRGEIFNLTNLDRNMIRKTSALDVARALVTTSGSISKPRNEFYSVSPSCAPPQQWPSMRPVLIQSTWTADQMTGGRCGAICWSLIQALLGLPEPQHGSIIIAGTFCRPSNGLASLELASHRAGPRHLGTVATLIQRRTVQMTPIST